jgi:predicted RND superfamily exporter protein
MLGARAFVRWTIRRGKWIWLATLLLAVPATWRTVYLYAHLRSEVEQLLPRSAPSVLAIDELTARMPAVRHLGVVIDFGTPENLPAADQLIDDLAARVRAYPPELARAVRTGDAAERRFLADHAPLYMDLHDLETVGLRIERRRDWEVSKQQDTLLDEDEPPPPLAFDDIQKRYDDQTASFRRFPSDRFASAALHTALMLVEVGELETGRARGAELLRRVKLDLADLRPNRYAPGMQIGFSGDVAINVEEREALLADLSVSSVVVGVLVVATIVFYYRWWRSILILLPPLLLAADFSFALASMWPLGVSELNSNTAFLGSIIVGNGINFGIVLLARYVEERRRGVGAEDAMVVGVSSARTGTLSAALAAGVSYGSLALTEFRGFRQFGFIGGIGMLLSWALAFVLMPSLAVWLDTRKSLPPRRGAVVSSVAALVTRHATFVVAGGALLTLSALWSARSFGAGTIETDFSKLRRADTWTRGEGYWGRRMDALLGSYVTPTVILTDDVDQARTIALAIREKLHEPPFERMIASVRTLDDVVPSDQERKIALSASIRDDLTPRVRAALSRDQLEIVNRFLGQSTLGPVRPDDLADGLAMGLRERDGTFGRAVLVYPKPGRLLWDGAALIDLVKRLRVAASTRTDIAQRPGRVAGSLPLSADILESVRRDGPVASAVALAGVIVVVLALLRQSRPVVMIVGSLLLGVLWQGGAMMALGIKINFANFIAYPITFGIGVDYSVNMVSRWELEGRGSMASVVRTTGGAVSLCSLTTIIGYSSLLLAENRALFLFGALAVLGEIACLSAAVVMLPALVECFTPSARLGTR